MKLEYAIVDIETTGGNATHSRITEIAIVVHDGISVIDRYETLINPEQHIPDPIFALTGINNAMVKNAPVFDKVAQKIYDLLHGRVFVAHNVNFDYSFVRHQLEQSGFKWTARKLCTVRAARKIRPGFSSYSLGNLCRFLDIPIENRHRAGGDADATVVLFSRLLQWDTNGELPKMILKTAPDQRLPPNLPPEDFEALPQKPGVYYFYNAAKKVVYVGKAINLKKRVASHFSGHKITPQRQHFLRDIHSISFEVCSSELMALLLECSEIKKLWPVYNTALKRFQTKFGLFQYEARSGYQYLAIGKLGKFQNCLQSFNNAQDAINTLSSLRQRFAIDNRFCKYGLPSAEMFQQSSPLQLPDMEQHNAQVDLAIASLSENRPSFAILDKGRCDEERSCIWVEEGRFYGMGYVPADIGFTMPSQVKDHVKRFSSDDYIMQLLYSFAAKYPAKVMAEV